MYPKSDEGNNFGSETPVLEMELRKNPFPFHNSMQ
jgi:hypothetical protein